MVRYYNGCFVLYSTMKFYKHLSRKNTESEYLGSTVFKLSEDDIIILAKNWDKIKNGVEAEIQTCFEESINNTVHKLSSSVGNLELLVDFNS